MLNANWIHCKEDIGDNVPLYKRDFKVTKRKRSPLRQNRRDFKTIFVLTTLKNHEKHENPHSSGLFHFSAPTANRLP